MHIIARGVPALNDTLLTSIQRVLSTWAKQNDFFIPCRGEFYPVPVSINKDR